MWALKTILSWLTGGGLASIGREINKWQEIKEKAKNDADRIEAETMLTQLQVRQSVLIAEQGHWLTRWIRPAFAFPFIVYNFKVIVWDKVFGLGVTDNLPDIYWELQMVVFGAYFLTRSLEKRWFK